MTAKITLLDGGLGQDLIRRSGKPPTPLWSAQVMLDDPDSVEALYLEHIASGAKVITLNNYIATPTRLSRDASLDLFVPIHTLAIEIAQKARKQSGQTDIQIAGCLPPLVASYKPELVPSAESCLIQYRELVDIQKDGIDVMLCETLATIRESVAAVTAAREAGLRTLVSFTLDDQSPRHLRSGEPLLEAVKALEPFDVEAICINCSMPETLGRALPALIDAFPKVGAYANGFQSIEALQAGGTTKGLKARHDLTPHAYAEYALRWAKMGAQLIGGCCEVGPAHIAAIRDTLTASGFELVALS